MNKGAQETETENQGPAFSFGGGPRLTLGVALRRYWLYLMPLALFPSFAFPAVTIYHLPFGFLAVLFFAGGLLAMWPLMRKRAPYSFWLVAMGGWMGGGFLGMCVLLLLRHFVK